MEMNLLNNTTEFDGKLFYTRAVIHTCFNARMFFVDYYLFLTELTSLKKLEVLNVGYNNLTGSIPISVSELLSLKALLFKRTS